MFLKMCRWRGSRGNAFLHISWRLISDAGVTWSLQTSCGGVGFGFSVVLFVILKSFYILQVAGIAPALPDCVKLYEEFTAPS